MKSSGALLLFISIPLLCHETLTTTVLFDREIVRILDKHCVMCHFAGGNAKPFETFDQTWLAKREIHTQVIARHMPPWAAVPGYGLFANDNSLTLRESQFVISWVEGLGPRNSGTVFLNVTGPDAARPAEIRTHIDFDHWELGEPSQTLPVPAFARTVVATGLKTSQQLRALEFMPDRRAVHAATFTIQETGQWIGSWTPWYGFMALPTGFAYRLPAGAHIVADLQYNGAASGDPGKLGLYYASGTAANIATDLALETATRAATTLARDTTLLALRPEIAPGVQSIEVSARRPNGTTEVLLFAKDFPAAWPTPYILKRPVALPLGTQIWLTVHSPPSSNAKVRLTVTRE